ncbi:response regulator [Actinoplanes aureus]|jgi:CheY-like chemotaxis protein|uniref:Response regulator n=1 Tax=Actinoplanes aureus TaxID=2792083 RepID=A0A931C6K3_9ACTN|nr:response regulator [Actinoplanes aureus]MBG0561071.1 response regulator [Actinoplanes aureus]
MAVLVIAEDDEDIALVLVRVFKRAGMTVFRAPDGQAALELILQERPDIVLTDLGMPRMDGWGLIAAVREHPDVRDTPIAILSGHLRPGDPDATSAQVCAILLKPCPNDRLLATMTELLEVGPHQHDGTGSRCPAALISV